jgi:hypothetical protein
MASAGTAAAAPPPPQAGTNCGGQLKPDPAASPTADEPNLLDYSFYCDGNITAYTLVVNRTMFDFETVDDFSTVATVVDSTGAVVSTEGFTCEGSLPGPGINCSPPAAGGIMSAGHHAQGNFDTADPYCANIPKGSKPGTQPELQAMVQLVVTDASGAQDGPFRLGIVPACKPVHVVKPKPKPKCKKKKNGKCPAPKGKKGKNAKGHTQKAFERQDGRNQHGA